MVKEDYVSFETAKLLKEKGFKEWCFKCYGVAVLHNGEDISFDEECDLKDEGRGDEIVYVEGGRLYDYGCNNHDKDVKVWAAPTLWVATKWLWDNYMLYILVYPWKGNNDECHWCCKVYDSFCHLGYDKFTDETPKSREDAYESGIKYCLKKLI